MSKGKQIGEMLKINVRLGAIFETKFYFCDAMYIFSLTSPSKMKQQKMTCEVYIEEIVPMVF